MKKKKSVAKKSVRAASKPAAKKAPTKKMPAKKPAAKSAKTVKAKPVAKKAATKAPASKKTSTKKIVSKATPKKNSKPVAKPASKSVSSKKTPVTKAAPAKKAQTLARSKAAAKTAPKSSAAEKVAPEVRRVLAGPRKRPETPVIFKTRVRRNTPVAFSLDDLHKHLQERKNTGAASPKAVRPAAVDKKAVVTKGVSVDKVARISQDDFPKPERRNLGAASVSDILGFNPQQERRKYEWGNFDEQRVPKKFIKHFKALLNLREHVIHGLQAHIQETLKRSSKEDSGDLSSYGQHMADAATDAFDRDFALSLLSNEQDALYEIDEAIQRIYDGSYGQCEITGEQINQERLEAVPFTRYSLKGQQEYERTHRRTNMRGNVLFADVTPDEASAYGEDDSDDS